MDKTYSTKVYTKQGGDEIVIASGGKITMEDGASFPYVDSKLTDITKKDKSRNYKTNYTSYNKYSKGILIDSCENLTNKTIANATMVLDTTNHSIGSNSLHITGAPVSTTADLTITRNADLSGIEVFDFDMYTTTTTYPTNVSISIYTSATDRFICNLGLSNVSFATPIVNGKNIIFIPKSYFTTSGSPNWATVTKIVLKFSSPAGYIADFYIDNIRFNDIDRRAVAFTFDDGYDNHYNLAYPILRNLGLKGSFAIVSSFIDTATYMTTAQLKEMYANGFDIVSHTKQHLDLSVLDYDTVYGELKGCTDYLTSIGVTTGLDILIYPIQISPIAKTVASDMGYRLARNATAGLNDVPLSDLLSVNCLSLTNATLSGTTLAFIEKMRYRGGILIFLIHKVTEAGLGVLEVPRQTIVDVGNYCVTNNIEVLSLTQLFDSIYGQ